MKPRFLASALLINLFSILAHGQIYKWVDANGKTHFSDQAPAKGQNTSVNLPSINGMKDVDTSALPSSSRVVMYSTVWCGYCKRARGYFKKNSIPFSEKDIEKGARAEKEYKRLKGNGVPLIMVGKTKLQGFDQRKFEDVYY